MGAAGALGGMAMTVWLFGSTSPAIGLSLPFVAVAGGWVWVEVLFEARLWPLLLVPAAPVALWCTQLEGVKKMRPGAAMAVGVACMLAAIVVAGAMLRMPVGG